MKNENTPRHYAGDGEITCIDAMRSMMHGSQESPYMGFLKGSVFKYIWREEWKGGIKDIDKAANFLKFIAAEMEEGDVKSGGKTNADILSDVADAITHVAIKAADDYGDFGPYMDVLLRASVVLNSLHIAAKESRFGAEAADGFIASHADTLPGITDETIAALEDMADGCTDGREDVREFVDRVRA